MKTFFKKYLYIITIFGAIALTLPFVKIISQASVDEMVEDGYSHISYDKLSAVNIVWEGIEYYFSQSVDGNEIIILALLVVLTLVALTQFIAGLFKKRKTVLYTAILLFSSFLALLIFTIQKSNDATICYGYYTYLVIQGVLIMASPSSVKKGNDKRVS
ncbi:hypothetical protein FMM05_11770 [Flavobacterium zepuense]|uniref:Uncharacterized protein n=1 Tax=Flavobacterium zepuense TaxID=2593302 RepID=A0A552V041_9FLAO|nr:hypothetical protein [Flavobacterium zepuense]TRW23834.1 hypothetical protein FMM05_11770 [Flavobacterium zepuense]